MSTIRHLSLRLAPWLACALLWGGCEDEAPQAPLDMGSPQEDLGADLAPDAAEDVAPDVAEDLVEDAADLGGDDAEADMEGPLAPGTVVIEPADLIVRLGTNEPREVMFVASVVGEDGGLTALPDVRWRVTNPALGGIDAQRGVWRGQGVGGTGHGDGGDRARGGDHDAQGDFDGVVAGRGRHRGRRGGLRRGP
jgi:hypothetical protein